MPIEEVVGSFFITLAGAIVCGIAILLILYKMIDGDFPVVPGLVAVAANLFVMAIIVRPPHPAIPGIALLVVVTLTCFFPYAAGVLEKIENDAIDLSRMERAYSAVLFRPDNLAARLEIAEMLHAQGFVHQAIAIAREAIIALPSEVDQVQNRSVRDLFAKEERRLAQWLHTPPPPNALPPVVACAKCGKRNESNILICPGCNSPYLLNAIQQENVQWKTVGKLLLSWAAIAVFFLGVMLIALNMKGGLMYVMIFAAGAAVFAFVSWLFKRPLAAKLSR